jgi:hypothetical protein
MALFVIFLVYCLVFLRNVFISEGFLLQIVRQNRLISCLQGERDGNLIESLHLLQRYNEDCKL